MTAAKLTWCGPIPELLDAPICYVHCARMECCLRLQSGCNGAALLCVCAALSRSMVTKNFLTNAVACRELFFSDDLPQAELDQYQRLLRDNASPVPVIEV